MNDYSTGPEFGGRLAKEKVRTARDIWWDQVIEFAKEEGGGDFVELLNCPVDRSTVSTYRTRPDRAPAAFLDPMFEIKRYAGRWWVRYISEAPAEVEA